MEVNANSNSDYVPVKTAAMGFRAYLMAGVDNASAVQDLLSDLMDLSSVLSKLTQDYSNYWLYVMDGANNPNSDMNILNNDTANNKDALTKDNATFQVHNTEYGQASTFFNGMITGVNDTTQNTTSQISLVYQLIQQITLALQNILTQCL